MVLVRYYGSKSEAQWICVVFYHMTFFKDKDLEQKKNTPQYTLGLFYT